MCNNVRSSVVYVCCFAEVSSDGFNMCVCSVPRLHFETSNGLLGEQVTTLLVVDRTVSGMVSNDV